MRADGHQSFPGVFGGLPKLAARIFSKVQQPIAEHAELPQPFANERLDGTQVLTDEDNFIPYTLERKNTKQVVRIIQDVCALAGILAFRDPKQPEEAHHMVDAQGAAVLAVLAYRFANKRYPSVRGQVNWAVEMPSPGRSARNHPAATRRGSLLHNTLDAPTSRTRSGPSQAPDRGKDRSSDLSAARAPELRESAVLTCHCTHL